MEALVAQYLPFFQYQAWLIAIVAIVIATFILNQVLRVVFNLLYHAAHKTPKLLDDAFIDALRLPTRSLMWVLCLYYSCVRLVSHFEADLLLEQIITIKSVLVVLLVAWFLFRFIRLGHAALLEEKHGRKPFDVTTTHAVCQLLRVLVFVFMLLAIMQSMGFAISGLLAFGGASTVVIGLAGKDILANFFGGLMIYMDKPFKVGDWVRSPDRSIEGTVEYIGWRLCRIRTFDKRPLYVPNSIFSTISIENPSRMQNRRIYSILNVRYDDVGVLPAILKAIKQMLQEHPDIDTQQTLMVNLVELGASSLNFMIYTFTKTTNWVSFQVIQEDVLFKIMQIIDEHGAECAFPTQTVHVPDTIKLMDPVTLKG